MEHVKELIETMASKIDELAKTKTVVGEPFEVQGKTLIPLIRVSLGIGGGGFMAHGEGGVKVKGEGRGEGKGGGTGAGVRISPLAILCVDEKGVSVFGISEFRGSVEKVTDLLPNMIDKILQAVRKKSPGEEKEKA